MPNLDCCEQPMDLSTGSGTFQRDPDHQQRSEPTSAFPGATRQRDAQPEVDRCFGLFTSSGVASSWIVGYSESMSLFPEPHMDDLHHLLERSGRQFLSDRFG